MGLVERLPETVWPSEPNVGGHHVTVRYASIPAMLALAGAALAGLLPGVAGPAAAAVAAFGVGVAGLSVVEIRTRKCFGYALLGVDTCPVPGADASAPPATEESA